MSIDDKVHIHYDPSEYSRLVTKFHADYPKKSKTFDNYVRTIFQKEDIYTMKELDSALQKATDVPRDYKNIYYNVLLCAYNKKRSDKDV